MISVCIATYNGEEFIEQQLNSVLSQLNQLDEVVIVDDCSKDNTVEIINHFHDIRINLIRNKKNKGPIKSFEIALKSCRGDFIFLADQDDCWMKNKVAKVMECFNSTKCGLIVHDAKVTDEDLRVTENSWNKYNHNRFTNKLLCTIIKNPFTGANMAFRREILSEVLPFSTNVMHDWWIGAVCQKKKINIYIIRESLMLYRRHGGNVTGYSHNVKKMFLNRIYLLFLLWRKN